MEPKTNTADAPKPAAPRRDKLASMAAAQQQRQQSKPKHRRGKFAKLAAAKQASSVSETTTETDTATSTATTTADTLEQEKALLQQRINQRQGVLHDLKEAESKTWKLLTLASSTAKALSDLDFDVQEVSKLSADYRETLQSIHSLLTPHAKFLMPYQNHKTEKEEYEQEEKEEKDGEPNMYASRVEMRLAMERQEVLSELLRLEKEQQEQDPEIDTEGADDSRKRPREE